MNDDQKVEKALQQYVKTHLQRFFDTEAIELISTDVKTPAGVIDILARTSPRTLLAISLVAGAATSDSITGLQGQMKAIAGMEEYKDSVVNGILVAGTIDSGLDETVSAAANVTAFEYSTEFRLRQPGNAETTTDTAVAEKWILDIGQKTFCRHAPRTDDYPLTNPRLVQQLVGNNDIEIHGEGLILGPYRKV